MSRLNRSSLKTMTISNCFRCASARRATAPRSIYVRAAADRSVDVLANDGSPDQFGVPSRQGDLIDDRFRGEDRDANSGRRLRHGSLGLLPTRSVGSLDRGFVAGLVGKGLDHLRADRFGALPCQGDLSRDRPRSPIRVRDASIARGARRWSLPVLVSHDPDAPTRYQSRERSHSTQGSQRPP